MLAVHSWPNVGPTLFTQRQHYANGTIVGPTLGQRRLAIWGVGVIICPAERCLRKIVISQENGYIQAGNDPTASHLLLTISMCKKILCKSSQIYQKICSTNNETSRRYFSSSSTNSESSRRYFSSRSMAKKTRCFS